MSAIIPGFLRNSTDPGPALAWPWCNGDDGCCALEGDRSSDQYLGPAGPEAQPGGCWLIFTLQERVHSLKSGMPTSRPYPRHWNTLDQNYWHLFQCGHLQNRSGLGDSKAGGHPDIVPYFWRLPGPGRVQALGAGLSARWSGGASLEGDAGLKDVMESILGSLGRIHRVEGQ